ncbi:hypothetical protein KXV85_004920, partial [Aspergillus fumigatus]
HGAGTGSVARMKRSVIRDPRARLSGPGFRSSSGPPPRPVSPHVKPAARKYSALPKFGIVVCVVHPGAIVRGDDPSSSSCAGERWTRQRRHEQAGRRIRAYGKIVWSRRPRYCASSPRDDGAANRRRIDQVRER